MHEAAFRALGMPHRYERIHATSAELAAVVARVRAGDYAGVNVTIPHKTQVLSLVDAHAPSAALAGAANTVVRASSGALTAHNTDAPALAEEIRSLSPRSLAGASALVLGTGGAARGTVLALLGLGVATVVVRGRRLVSAAARRDLLEELVALGARAGAGTAFEVAALEPHPDDARFAVVVQATSAGMAGADSGEGVAAAVRFESLAPEAVAIDLVYRPTSTPFLRAAAARGLSNQNGLGMLARQGALAFEHWLGVRPPLDVMLRAIGGA